MHPHPSSRHVTVHVRHALSISGSGGGVGLRRLSHDYGAIEIDSSNSEIKFDGDGAGAKANESDADAHDHGSIGKGRGSELSRGRMLLDAYGDSLKHVALMLWRQGYGMHQRKVRSTSRHDSRHLHPHPPHLPCLYPPPPPTLTTLLGSRRCPRICLI